MANPAYRLSNQRRHQMMAPAYHRRRVTVNSSVYLSLHSPTVVLQEETAIIGETCVYWSNRIHSYNRRNIEIEEQVGRQNSRFPEQTVIIRQTYLPNRARSNHSHLYNQPTYEENLELEERMGRVDSRLSEETIMRHLKIRRYDATSKRMDEEPDICVICQGEYEKDELIGGLHCRHEYHVECVKKWLRQHNSCPICKADAVSHFK